jgi:hypothetical protein
MKAVLRRLDDFARAVALLGVLAGCVDLYSDAVRWPAEGDGVPAQPVRESVATGVTLCALAIEWTPDAVVVELEISNAGEGNLGVERSAIMGPSPRSSSSVLVSVVCGGCGINSDER